MNIKFFFCSLVLFLMMVSEAFSQQKISILGDSYSTFYAYVTPETNLCWYGVPGEEKENDVRQVEETWWYRFINDNGYKLECNNSYSGSTICHTGYEKKDYSDRSFVTRMYNLGNPDIIFILVEQMIVGQGFRWGNSNIVVGQKRIFIVSVLHFAVCWLTL